MSIASFLHRFQLQLLAVIIVGLFAAILSSILFFEIPQEKTKIGFITLGDIREPGWNASNYEGMKAACDHFGLELLVRDHIRENCGECPRAIRDLVSSGCKMIYLCSYAYAEEVRALVGEFPQVAFTTSSDAVHARNMTSNFVRMYQGYYLAGALAGLRTARNSVGFIAAINNSKVNRSINAFALGMKRSNPNAELTVLYTGEWDNVQKEEAAVRRLINEAGIDCIAYYQDDQAVAYRANQLGIDFIGYNSHLPDLSDHCLATIICHWDMYYRNIIQLFLKGELNSMKNHWYGVENNVIEMMDFSSTVSPEMKIYIHKLSQELMHYAMIFKGPLKDNQGSIRCAEGMIISDETLLTRMNWHLEGVTILE